MTPERLLAEFSRVGDALDAVPRLRRFVIDLAVRGKLVPQDSGDEPASALLKRIAAEKARLVKRGEIKAEKPLLSVEGDADFEIPLTWRWTRLGIVTSYLQRGKSPKYAVADGCMVVSQKCVQWSGLDLAVAKQITRESLTEYEVFRFLRDGDLLWNSTGTGTIGRIIRVVDPPEMLVCDSHVTVVRCLQVLPEYVRTWLRSDHVYALIEGRASGSTNQVELTAQMALNQVVPLPPLAEQHRIVAKVDELMALCDRLEAARREREVTRDRLTAASLARLNTPDPDPTLFAAHARFALTTLPTATTRPDQIKPLRQTILNLAVRGLLVPQDPTDEPAAVLLKRTAAERARLVKAGAIRSVKPSVRDQSYLTHKLPASWEALSLGSVCNMVTSGSRGWGEFYADTGPKFVRAQNIRFGRLQLDTLACVDLPTNAEGVRTQVSAGDLLVVITGAGVTNPALLDCDLGEAYVSQHVGLIKLTDVQLSRWLLLCLMAPSGGRAELIERAYGSGKPGLNLDNIRSLSVPLPPLAEQHRILARVDSLMALCDRLEASLAAGATIRTRLLDALLAEALAPTETREEAA